MIKELVQVFISHVFLITLATILTLYKINSLHCTIHLTTELKHLNAGIVKLGF